VPFLDLMSIRSFLVCPRCRSPLVEAARSFQCSSVSCALRGTGPFPCAEKWPVLVDFEDSIIEAGEVQATAGGNPLSGRRQWSRERLPAVLRRWWGKTDNRVAAANMDRLLSLIPEPSPVVLVVGGATVGNGMDTFYTNPRARLLAFDIYGSEMTQFIADAHQMPVATQSMDAVVIQAVLEHVLDPARVVAEIHRVLRDGGLVYAETPFLQHVHAGPYDFVRYTSSGHRYLFRQIEEIAAGPVAGPGTQLLWSVDHLTRALTRSELAGKLTRVAFFWLRFLDRFASIAFTMDSASAFYFLGRRSSRSLTCRDIVRYYRGAQRLRS
jgi:SAM-dependent methyltransferase